ncbi:MAG: 2OG-Fe(II) oxygenase [Cyanobacteria bacterium P01_F01_bin.150]
MASKSAAKSKSSGKRRSGSKKKPKSSGRNLNGPESIGNATGQETSNYHVHQLDAEQVDGETIEANAIAVTLLLSGGHEYHLALTQDSLSLKQLFAVLLKAPEERCSHLFQLPVHADVVNGREQNGQESALCFTGDRLVGIVTTPPMYIKQPHSQEPISEVPSSKPPTESLARQSGALPKPPATIIVNPINADSKVDGVNVSTEHHYAVVASPERESHLAPGVIPSRYIQLTDFLMPDLHRRVFDHSIAQQSAFVGSSTSTGDLDYRQSSVLHHFPEFADMMRDKIHQAFADVIASLELNPFDITQIEAQLTAHNDGHYYKVHNDNGSVDTATRVLTYVYYFHRDPKPFAGGALRIYDSRIQNNYYVQAESFQDITPINNSIVFFPSHYMHEVLPIICPSRQFADSRFTINGWVRR